MSQDSLFTGRGVADIRGQAIAGIVPRVEEFTEDQLQGISLDELAQYVADYVMGQTVELRTENHRIDVSTVLVSELDAPVPVAPNGPQPGPDVVQLTLYIPYTGTRQVFRTQPSRVLTTPTPQATLTDREVIISVVVVPGEDGQTAESRLLVLERNLGQWVNAVNSDVTALKSEVKTTARHLIAQRVSVRQQRDDIAAALTVPLVQKNHDQAFEVPLRRIAVSPSASPTPPGGNATEWTIAHDVYEGMIRTVLRFTHALERRPSSAEPLIANEETMRDWLMFLLRATYETPDGRDLFIGGETENGAGKTDILVRYEDKNAFIGECKFWHGQKKLGEAIDQLLSYTVWRDTKAALILFITSMNATGIIEKAAAALAQHPQCVEPLTPADSSKRRDYRFTSPSDPQRLISLALLPVIVPLG